MNSELEISRSVDWLTMTRKQDLPTTFQWDAYELREYSAETLQECQIGASELRVDRNARFYDQSFICKRSSARIDLSRDARVQGCRIVLSGQAMRALEDVAATMQLLEARGWHCTRIDLAVDIKNSDISVDAVAHEYQRVHPQTNKRGFGYTQRPSGSSFEIGSRTSPRYLRSYDKAKEKGMLDVQWTRYEIEYKSDRAPIAFAAARQDTSFAFGEIAGMLDMPGHAHYELFIELGRLGWKLPPSARKIVGDRKRWYFDVVAPALAKLMVEDGDQFRAVTERIAELAEALQSRIDND